MCERKEAVRPGDADITRQRGALAEEANRARREVRGRPEDLPQAAPKRADAGACGANHQGVGARHMDGTRGALAGESAANDCDLGATRVHADSRDMGSDVAPVGVLAGSLSSDLGSAPMAPPAVKNQVWPTASAASCSSRIM